MAPGQQVDDIFRIERPGEGERYLKSWMDKELYEGKCDRRLLYCGARLTDFPGILSQGLRLPPPEAPVQGYAWGKGVCFADASEKATQRCFQEVTDKTLVIMMCEVELGTPMYQLNIEDYSAEARAKELGCYSTYATGCIAPERWNLATNIREELSAVTIVRSS